MNVYSIDVMIAATAYIKADSPEEAMAKVAAHLVNQEMVVAQYADGTGIISGRRFSDPALPDVSLSPAMTIHGPWEGQKLYLMEESQK
jgi:hypothetical protein